MSSMTGLTLQAVSWGAARHECRLALLRQATRQTDVQAACYRALRSSCMPAPYGQAPKPECEQIMSWDDVVNRVDVAGMSTSWDNVVKVQMIT